jgi:hypothetical protein
MATSLYDELQSLLGCSKETRTATTRRLSSSRPLMRPGRRPKALERHFPNRETMQLERAARNRASAQASRSRKKERIEFLESQNRQLQNQTITLMKQIEELKKQNEAFQNSMDRVSSLVQNVSSKQDDFFSLFLKADSFDTLASGSILASLPSDLNGAALAGRKIDVIMLSEPRQFQMKERIRRVKYNMNMLLNTIKTMGFVWMNIYIAHYGNKVTHSL